MKVDDGVTVNDNGLYVATNGLTIDDGGINITGGLTVYDKGTLIHIHASIYSYMLTHTLTFIYSFQFCAFLFLLFIVFDYFVCFSLCKNC